MSVTPPSPENPASIEPTRTGPALHTPWLTLFICIACIGVYLWQGWTLGHYSNLSGADLAILGGNVPSLSLGPQPWRLASSIFLHESPIHLIFNLAGMLLIVAVLEALVARWKWVVLFLAGSLFSSFASACVNYGAHDVAFLGRYVHRLFVSVGISGAIMSAGGALIVFAVRQWPAKDQETHKRILRGALAFTVINLIYGFTQSGVDNTAHVYGLIFGVLGGVALLLPHTSQARWMRGMVTGIFTLAFATIIAWISTGLWKRLPPAQERMLYLKDTLHTIVLLRAERQAANGRALERRQKLDYVNESDAIARRIPVPNVAKIVPLSEDGKVLVATNGDASRIIKYDLKRGKPLRVVAKVDYPAGAGRGCPDPKCSAVGVSNLVIDGTGTYTYASTLYRGSVSAIDLASGRIAYTLHTGTYPSCLLLRDGRLYAYDELDNTISVMDADGRHPMVLLALSDAVLGISPASNSVRRVWQLDNNQNTWITKTMDGRRFYLPGSKNTQIFDMTRSAAPGDIGRTYNTLAKIDQRQWQ
ncbi:MAG TPA: rhomboid family intramembrane serine protease [Burkholderiaceae bacterium]|nr:rhomboid family intramembrane serine protease [Burkholderiaceae bacterium]